MNDKPAGKRTASNSLCSHIQVPSIFGDIVIVWEGTSESSPIQLRRIYLPNEKTSALSRARQDFENLVCESMDDPPLIMRIIINIIQSTLTGIPADRSCVDAILETTPLSPFARRALSLEARIPHGHVSSYRALAEATGNPRAVRAVAHVLSENPFPLLIPCHRVIASNGALAGFQGGLAMKQYLLGREGIPFLPDSRVDLTRAQFWTFSS